MFSGLRRKDSGGVVSTIISKGKVQVIPRSSTIFLIAACVSSNVACKRSWKRKRISQEFHMSVNATNTALVK